MQALWSSCWTGSQTGINSQLRHSESPLGNLSTANLSTYFDNKRRLNRWIIHLVDILVRMLQISQRLATQLAVSNVPEVHQPVEYAPEGLSTKCWSKYG